MRLVNLEDQKDRSQICGSLSNPRILFSIWLLTPKTEFKIRRSAYPFVMARQVFTDYAD